MTEISDFQRGNLLKLADYLEKLPDDYEHFDMADFHSKYVHACKIVPECGTVACAVGHGPSAGIKPKHDEGWSKYSKRVFLTDEYEWDWCFSSAWDEIDNTPKGAAARIRWLLEKGLPKNIYAQAFGLAPLCYKENT